MTTGRINQVRTVGGAGAPAAPRPGGPDGSARAPRPGLAPGPLELCRRARGPGLVRAASDARARLPAPRGSAPRAGPGAERGPTRLVNEGTVKKLNEKLQWIQWGKEFQDCEDVNMMYNKFVTLFTRCVSKIHALKNLV